MCTQLVLPLCCVCKLTQEKLWELHVNFFGSSLNDLEALTVAKKKERKKNSAVGSGGRRDFKVEIEFTNLHLKMELV